jgi:hypothetical protein
VIRIDINNNIRYTYGDTLALEYCLENYVLQEGDVATLSIKQGEQVMLNCDVATAGACKFTFIVAAEDMAMLPVGRYTYDVHIKFADGRVYTFDYMRELLIVEVAHE